MIEFAKAYIHSNLTYKKTKNLIDWEGIHTAVL